MDTHRDADEAVFADATRRTYLARERMLLAWVADGARDPDGRRSHWLDSAQAVPSAESALHRLGAVYAALSIRFVLLGAYRQRTNDYALAERRYPGLKRGMVTALAVNMTALVVATCWVLFWGPG